MSTPNTFNVHLQPAVAGDNLILEADYNAGYKLFQLNIQNQDDTNETEISVKVGGVVVTGPLKMPANGFLNLELLSGGNKPYYDCPNNAAVEVNSSAAVDMLVFGYAELT